MMGSQTEYWCDTCGEKFYTRDKLKSFPRKDGGQDVDVCENCRNKIVSLAVAIGRVGNSPLRPFCKRCGGKGTVIMKEWDYDSCHKRTEPCDNCNL